TPATRPVAGKWQADQSGPSTLWGISLVVGPFPDGRQAARNRQATVRICQAVVRRFQNHQGYARPLGSLRRLLFPDCCFNVRFTVGRRYVVRRSCRSVFKQFNVPNTLDRRTSLHRETHVLWRDYLHLARKVGRSQPYEHAPIVSLNRIGIDPTVGTNHRKRPTMLSPVYESRFCFRSISKVALFDIKRPKSFEPWIN